MPIDVLMPIIDAEGEEAVVTAWLVDEGTRVKPAQLIAEVQAEKVSVDVEAPAAGVVRGLVPINQPVAQGSPICRIEDAPEDVVAPTPPAPGASQPTGAPAAPPVVAASPAARRLAGELGVSLETLSGSGPGGRITETDVRAAAGGGEGTEATGPGEAMVGLRAVIARNMRQSHAATAPVTITTTADVTGRVPERITAWVVRAVALALEKHPNMNGTRQGDMFRPAEVTGISLAIQTEQGLVAPVIRDPGSKGLRDLAQEIASLAEKARSRSLTTADYEGGTFSVTNLGGYGVDAFTPIINLPQMAILGVGAIRTVAGFIDDRVVPMHKVVLSLTFDHAFIDGGPAAAFLAEIRRRLGGED